MGMNGWARPRREASSGCGSLSPPLDKRRVLRVRRPRGRRKAWEVRDARIDEHIAHKECRLDGVVGEVAACGVDGDAGRGRACRLTHVRLVSSGFCRECIVCVLVIHLIDVTVSVSWVGDGMGVRGHLGNRQLVGLLTDVLAWRMEGRRDCGRTLSHHTHYTTRWVRQVKGGTCATELVTDDLEEKIVLSGGERTSVALYPANVIVSHE